MRIGTILMAALAVAPAVNAQEAEVIAAIEEQLGAWSAGDIQGFAAFYDADVRGFNIDGGPVALGFNSQMVEMALQAGFIVTFAPRDIDVKIVGTTAIAVGYLDGSITIPGADPKAGTWRYSETRVNVDGVWKVVQYHFSEMSAAMGPAR